MSAILGPPLATERFCSPKRSVSHAAHSTDMARFRPHWHRHGPMSVKFGNMFGADASAESGQGSTKSLPMSTESGTTWETSGANSAGGSPAGAMIASGGASHSPSRGALATSRGEGPQWPQGARSLGFASAGCLQIPGAAQAACMRLRPRGSHALGAVVVVPQGRPSPSLSCVVAHGGAVAATTYLAVSTARGVRMYR